MCASGSPGRSRTSTRSCSDSMVLNPRRRHGAAPRLVSGAGDRDGRRARRARHVVPGHEGRQVLNANPHRAPRPRGPPVVTARPGTICVSRGAGNRRRRGKSWFHLGRYVSLPANQRAMPGETTREEPPCPNRRADQRLRGPVADAEQFVAAWEKTVTTCSAIPHIWTRPCTKDLAQRPTPVRQRRALA